MTSPTRLFCVVLAGGESRRLGINKLSHHLGSQTVLDRVLSGLSASSFEKILVILGPRSHALADSLPRHAQALRLEHQTHDMRTTLETGIDHLRTQEAFGERDAVLVALGDQPTLSNQVVEQLVSAYCQQPERIAIPTFQGKRGHPIILPGSLALQVKSLPEGAGLNALVQSATNIHHVEISDPSIVEDLDTPDDLIRYESMTWK